MDLAEGKGLCSIPISLCSPRPLANTELFTASVVLHVYVVLTKKNTKTHKIEARFIIIVIINYSIINVCFKFI